MISQENLRRTAGIVGTSVVALSLARLTTGSLSFSPPSADVVATVTLSLLGLALALHTRSGRARVAGLGAATLALAGTLGGAVWSAEGLFAASTMATTSLPLDTLVLFAATAVAMICHGQPVVLARRPLSVWIATFLFAISVATLMMTLLSQLTIYVRALAISPANAATVLVLAVGLLLTHTDGKLTRLLLAQSPARGLARRLFYGVALLPATLIGLTLVLMGVRIIEPLHGPVFLMSSLIIAGLVTAMASAEAAAGLDERRRAAEGEHARLNAVLEQQAARLQELVARRTSELRTLSVSLRTTTRENAQLGLVARNTTNGVVITDAEGRLEWANSAFERMTGYSLAEIKGRKPGHFLQGPDTDPVAVAQMRQAIHAGERCYVEILNYTKSRHPYWQVVDMEPVRDAAGKLINWISIQTDVTAHRLSEQHLRVLNERLRLATQSAALGVWEWDAQTQRHTWDDRTHAIHGLKPGEFDGSFEAWMQCLHPDDRSLARSRFDLVLAGGDFYDQEFRVVQADEPNEIRHVESRAIVQRDAQGKLVRITGTSRDITAERKNEERLEALNDRLQLALRASRYGVWDLDLATGRLIWDERMYHIYGVEHATFPGTLAAWLDLMHPDDRQRVERDTTQREPGNDEIDNEFRIVVGGGFIRHVETHGYIRRDAQGRPVRIVGMDCDITAEKQTIEALRMAEERWQLAVEGTNDGVWDWNIPTGVTYHDQRWSQMLGYEPGELANTIDAWDQLIHPDDLPGVLQAREDHFTRHAPLYHQEYRMRTQPGEWKWIMDRGKVVTRDPDGQPKRMVGMHTDVTARKNLEQRLHQFEQLATQVSELTQIGGWELDLETMQLTWSEQVRRLHEVDADYRPTIHTSIEFFAPEARDAVSTALKAAMTQGRDYDLELPLITAAGHRIWVRTLTRAEFRDHKPVRLIGALQDISSRRDSEEARRKLEFQLFQAQKMETLGTLAGGIAHDFNNLLTGIMGYQELVADVLGDNDVARDYLAQARSASVRARELVEQILTFGRQSADDQHMALDLSQLVEEARRLLRATIPATITIETHIAPDCDYVLGDATQLHQVLLNLGSNAAHAMHAKGGVLSIMLRRADRTNNRSATLGTLPAGDYVELVVQDTGYGMDESTLQRIFDPFFTTKEVREGTGLGLAVVHGIVRAHRGAIDVESQPGVGSAFHIYLPVAAHTLEDSDEEVQLAPRGEGETIYIVDDEDTVASFTKFALENKGYHAITVDTAAQCLELLRHNPHACAVLVTDQTMPGITGTELTAQLRPFAPDLPVIVMSGYFLKIPPEEMAALGRIDLLGKPFTTDELAWTVHRALHPAPAPA